jgi:hypothetical protein
MKIKLRCTSPFLSVATLLTALLVSVSCSTTTKTAEWIDQTYKGGPFRNVLIIGVSSDADVRRSYEDTFVSELQKRRIIAVPSYTIMAADTKITQESVRAAIKERDIDAVLITHLIKVEEEYRAKPFRRRGLYINYYGYYSRVYDCVNKPGQCEKHETVRLAIRLYDAKSEKMVWSMQSETVDAESDTSLINSTVMSVIKELDRKNLIGKRMRLPEPES